jgi:hypothetical protein
MSGSRLAANWKQNGVLIHWRWLWHVLFWTGYVLFRFWAYYITLKYYPGIYLQYMLLSELIFVVVTYLTLWLYRQLFQIKKYLVYFSVGAGIWLLYLTGRTVFQLNYLAREPSFRGSTFTGIIPE